MRISDHSLRSLISRDLQSRMAAVVAARRHATTGLRVGTASDAPADAARLVRMDGQLRDMEQYRRASSVAATRLQIEESVVRAARELIQQAKELTASVANTAPGDPLRQAADTQIQQIQDQLVSLGNTRLGDEYVFAGGLTGSEPFLPDGTYVGDSTERRAAIDDGLTVVTTHTGDTLLGSAFAALQAAQTGIQTGTTPQLQASVGALNAAGQDLLTREAENSSRQLTIVRTRDTLARRGVGLLDSRDSLAGADPTESALELVSAQNALERAYAAVGRMMQSSLLDFLR